MSHFQTGNPGRSIVGSFFRRSFSAALAWTIMASSTLPVSGQFDEPWRWITFRTVSGLPSNQILGLCETSDGIAWVATPGGLAWFDGYRWNPAASQVPSEKPSAMTPTPDGRLAVVTGGNLFIGDEDGFEPVQLFHEAEPVRPVWVAYDDSGNAYLVGRKAGMSERGLFRLLNEELHAVRPEWTLPNRGSSPILQTPDWGVWVNFSNRVARAASDGWTPMLAIPGGGLEVRLMAANSTGDGLAFLDLPASHRGLWQLSQGEFRRLPDEGQTEVSALDLSVNGEAIAIYESGEVRIRDQNSWRSLSPVPAQLLDVNLVRFRQNGDLWVGTNRGLSLYRRSSQRWSRLRFPFPDQRNRVSALFSDAAGLIWSGTRQGAVAWNANGQPIRSIRSIQGMELGEITGINQDSKGGIWLSSGSSFHGAFRGDGFSWRHYGVAEGLEGRVHRIVTDRSGNLWFLGLHPDVTSGPGAYHYKDGRFRQWGVQQGLLSGRVYAFAEGPDGSYWFATLKGLSRWREQAWTHWTAANGLRRDKTFTLNIDGDGRVWFGDELNGLGYIDHQDRPRYLTIEDGLMDNSISEIVWDENWGLIVGGIGGFSILNQDNWFNFNTTMGLSKNRVWPILPLGKRIYIGTFGAGIDILNLDQIEQRTPRIELEEPQLSGSRAILRWRPRAFWGDPDSEDIETRYRLADSPWTRWSTFREVVLEDLAYGPHHFQVQAKGMVGTVGYAEVYFQLSPPLYMEPLFQLAMAGLFGVVIAGAMTLRRRRRRYVDLIRESEERHRALFTAAGEAIAIVRLDDLSIIDANLKAKRLSRQVRGLDSPRTLEDMGVPERLKNKLLSGNQDAHEYAPPAEETGVNLTLEVRGNRLAVGSSDVLQCFFRDITAQKQAAAERILLEKEVQQAQKLESLEIMAGGIAHDFNNILTAVMGNANLLSMEIPETSDLRVYVHQIEDSAARAARLTQQMLAFSGRGRLKVEPIELNHLITTEQGFAAVLVGARAKIEYQLAESGPAVLADQQQLRRLYLDLLTNAAEAVDGNGTVRVFTGCRACDRDFLSTTVLGTNLPAGEYAFFGIEDDGCGIESPDLPRIFDPFFSTKFTGRGLGLASGLGIVRGHGGAIHVESRPREGTRLTIFFPLARIRQEA